jgi:type IV pilus biogenesis protein CpaD/CtpE
MAIDRTRLIAVLAGAAALSGCASGQASMGWGKGDNFGEASRQTFAAQVINPNPVYDEPYAVGNGAKAAAAVERYRTDKVKVPMVQRTSSFGTTGGAGAGSGGGN